MASHSQRWISFRGHDKPILGSGDRHRSFPGGFLSLENLVQAAYCCVVLPSCPLSNSFVHFVHFCYFPQVFHLQHHVHLKRRCDLKTRTFCVKGCWIFCKFQQVLHEIHQFMDFNAWLLPPKTNECRLKNSAWKTTFLVTWHLFWGHVSLGRCTSRKLRSKWRRLFKYYLFILLSSEALLVSREVVPFLS